MTPLYGARPLRRLVQSQVGDRVARVLLRDLVPPVTRGFIQLHAKLDGSALHCTVHEIAVARLCGREQTYSITRSAEV